VSKRPSRFGANASGAASKYRELLWEYHMARGRKKKVLRKKASHYRKRMIGRKVRRNRSHGVRSNLSGYGNLKSQMPRDYRQAFDRISKSRTGKKALARYRRFIGIPVPTNISMIKDGSKGTKYLVGMGRAPVVLLADGPEGKHRKIKKIKGKWIGATNSAGTRIYLLKKNSRGPVGKNLKFVGYAPETHYVLTPAQEKAGSFKRGKYWVHRHGKEEKGKWPKVYRDSSGNYVYGPGTYRVSDWIRR
jgi:hypothetical protein